MHGEVPTDGDFQPAVWPAVAALREFLGGADSVFDGDEMPHDLMVLGPRPKTQDSRLKAQNL